jgi:hypothetical protein
MVMQWIDCAAGLAYVRVRDRLADFDDFLQAITRLISDQSWRPGMPIVEDLTEFRGDPPPEWLEQWCSYVAEQRRWLEGCRWAVIRGSDDPGLVSILDAAAEYGIPLGISLRHFTNAIDAHAWISGPWC